jgi:hypothetical protein
MGCATLRLVLLAGVCALVGCASPDRAPDAGAAAELRGWQVVALPGKRQTQYRWVQKDGAVALHALADGSASVLRRRVDRAPHSLGEVEFEWLVSAVPREGDVSAIEHEDAAARVIFSFDGDEARLSARNRMLFDLAQALTGEAPPFATLMYVWDETAPVGAVIVNPRSDRIRKIVVESGTAAIGQWRRYRRDLAADYRLAFGEAPGVLLSVGVMTDGDNTQSRLSTWYRDVTLH